MLKDLRMIEKKYGLDETYSFLRSFLEMETYSSFLEELIVGIIMSLGAVFCVIFFITVNL